MKKVKKILQKAKQQNIHRKRLSILRNKPKNAYIELIAFPGQVYRENNFLDNIF